MSATLRILLRKNSYAHYDKAVLSHQRWNDKIDGKRWYKNGRNKLVRIFFSFQKKLSKSKAKISEFLTWEYVELNTEKTYLFVGWTYSRPLSSKSEEVEMTCCMSCKFVMCGVVEVCHLVFVDAVTCTFRGEVDWRKAVVGEVDGVVGDVSMEVAIGGRRQ